MVVLTYSTAPSTPPLGDEKKSSRTAYRRIHALFEPAPPSPRLMLDQKRDHVPCNTSVCTTPLIHLILNILRDKPSGGEDGGRRERKDGGRRGRATDFVTGEVASDVKRSRPKRDCALPDSATVPDSEPSEQSFFSARPACLWASGVAMNDINNHTRFAAASSASNLDQEDDLNHR